MQHAGLYSNHGNWVGSKCVFIYRCGVRHIDAVLCRLHVPERHLGGGRATRFKHVVPDRKSVRVLRLFNDRLPNRAVGDDRRGVSQADQGHARWCGYVRRTFLHIHRAPDVPYASGTGHKARYVRRVRCRVSA